MNNDALHREVDELFRQAKVLREDGRYTESMNALRAAADLINRCVGGQQRSSADPPGKAPVG
jgi:hypothetical protein